MVRFRIILAHNMITLSTTVSMTSFSRRIFNNQTQAWSHHKMHPNMSQSVICFCDQYNNVKKQNRSEDWLQFCKNKEEIGLEERF